MGISETQCGRKPPWKSAGVRFASLALSSTLVACASVPNPTTEMATARAAVDSARRAGAGELAPAEMGSAQTLLTRAERAQAAEEYQTAKRAAEQAQATGCKGIFSFDGVHPTAAVQAAGFRDMDQRFGLSAVMAVPEPASWAMMIVGIGAAGGALRRRRTHAVVTLG